MGESAGAASILHHITANSNLPAFKSAIVQSPGFFPQPNQTREDETYETFLNLTGTKSLDELWEADSHVLMRANAEMAYNSSYGLFAFGPTIDGYYVTDLPCKDLKEGRLHTNINLLAGILPTSRTDERRSTPVPTGRSALRQSLVGFQLLPRLSRICF